MKNKEISFLISSLGGGGAERVSVTLANWLVLENYTVRFLVLNLKDEVYKSALNKNIELINLNVKHARTSFFALKKILKKNQTRKILVFNHELAIILVLVRLFTRIDLKIAARNISTLSEKKIYEKSFWHKYIKDIFIRLFYGRVDLLIAQSEKMKNDLMNSYGFTNNKIVVINNPISPKFEDNVRAGNFETGKKKNEILYAGRLSKVKGLRYLFDAFKEVLKYDNSLKLRLVGGGELLEELTEYSKALNIDQNILFDGHKSDIIPYYKKARITVLTSLYEGFPNVLIESITVGTPIVSFDCKSGPSEIISSGINGFLVNYLDVNHLTESIIQALNHEWNIKKIKQTAEKYQSKNIMKEYMKII